jgi:hypothetical protein
MKIDVQVLHCERLARGHWRFGFLTHWQHPTYLGKTRLSVTITQHGSLRGALLDGAKQARLRFAEMIAFNRKQ